MGHSPTPRTSPAGGQLRGRKCSGVGGSKTRQDGRSPRQPGSLDWWRRGQGKRRSRQNPELGRFVLANLRQQQRKRQEGRKRKRKEQGEDPRKVTGPAEALGDALALAGREDQLSLEPTGSLPVTSFTDSLRFCTSFKRIGCVLLWWVVAGCTGPELDSITKELCDCWMNPPVSQAHVGRAKPRGSTFPLREGDLHEVVGVFRRVALQSAVGDDHVARWWADAWVCLALRGLP